MKINFFNILVVLAVILLVALAFGIVSNILPNFYLSPPTVELKECQYRDSVTGEIVTAKKFPENRLVEKATFSISEVKGASRYDVYVNGEFCMSTERPEFDLSDFRDAEVEEYNVKVRAVREVSEGDPIVSNFSKVIYFNAYAG
ncbi:MAG: hypothetical protein IKJ04_09740 [Clostridia bacterium]|nr:hypothetical protein [Clostridia bacterium]MBR4035078.1 hypothetical protein [Clostridia bacterium]